MAPIEIAPDGTPIVTPNPSEKSELDGAVALKKDGTVTSDFVAAVQEHLDEKKDEKPAEVIPPTGPGNPAPQHNHLIESAREFNRNIGNPSPPAPSQPKKVENLPTTATPAKMTTHATSGVRTPSARERVMANPGPVKIRINPSLMAQIRSVLKDNGMDSQQQEQALQRIGELLHNYRG